MRRMLAVFGVMVMLAACGIAGWVAVRPSSTLFVVPGAQDVQMTAQRLGT